MWRFVLCAFLVPTVLWADGTSTSPVLDPSFESQALNSVSPPWHTVGNGAVIDGGADAKHGESYLRLGSAQGGWVAVTQKVKVESRTRHVFKAHIKALGTANDVRLQVLAEDGALAVEKSFAAKADWSVIDLEFSTADENYLTFVVGLMGGPGEMVVVDGIQLTNVRVGMRENWTYIGGSYLIEKNVATQTENGKITNKFKVVDRNPEFVEIALNGFSTRIRLYADYATVNQGGSEFKKFRRGQWDDRRVWFYKAPTFQGFFILKPGSKIIEQQTNGNSWDFDETVRSKDEVIFKNAQRNVEVKITERESFMRTGNGNWEKLWDGDWNSISWGGY